jgi:hypothetical protein
MIYTSLLIVSLVVGTFGTSSVTDLIGRFESPNSFGTNDLTYYKEGSTGSYSDGSTMSFDSSSSSAYFCGVYSVTAGQKVIIKFVGSNSGYTETKTNTFTKSATSGLAYGFYLINWATDSALVITATIYDSSGSIVNSKQITINISFGSSGEVTDLVVRLSSPGQVFDDYTEDGSNVYLNGDTITVSSLSTIIYFCSVYAPAVTGYGHNLKVVGVLSGNSQSSSIATISSSGSGYAACQGWSARYWSNDDSLTVYSYYYDSSNNIISQKSLVINVQVSGTVSSGYCEEKPGKTKPSCVNQKTQSACENYSKCQWIS